MRSRETGRWRKAVSAGQGIEGKYQGWGLGEGLKLAEYFGVIRTTAREDTLSPRPARPYIPNMPPSMPAA
jgi:hypothetical protein